MQDLSYRKAEFAYGTDTEKSMPQPHPVISGPHHLVPLLKPKTGNQPNGEAALTPLFMFLRFTVYHSHRQTAPTEQMQADRREMSGQSPLRFLLIFSIPASLLPNLSTDTT